MGAGAQPAVWRPTAAGWEDCEILGCLDGQYVIREVGKIWPGVALTPQIRIPVGVVFQPEILARYYVPAGISRQKWRLLREEYGREGALAALVEHQEGGS